MWFHLINQMQLHEFYILYYIELNCSPFYLFMGNFELQTGNSTMCVARRIRRARKTQVDEESGNMGFNETIWQA